MRKLPKSTYDLQSLQNIMIRLILDLNINQHVNMQKVREKIHMFSVNQIAVYHTILEAYNVVRNSTSEQIKSKWEARDVSKYTLRSKTKSTLKVPEKPIKSCDGFTYQGSKLYNILPCNIKESSNPSIFKYLTRNWIWKNIPSY